MGFTLESKLREYLADADTIGNGFYLGKPTQSASLPYGVVKRVAPGALYTLAGKIGLSVPSARVSCFGKTYYQASQLARDIDRQVHKWAGDEEIIVQEVELVTENELFADGVHQVEMQFDISHVLLEAEEEENENS